MKTFLISLILFGSVLQAQEAIPDKEEMVTRQYYLQIHRWTQITQTQNQASASSNLPWARKEADPEAMKAFFTENFRIEFPEGSWIRNHKSGSSWVITMHNTLINQERLRYTMLRSGAIPLNVNLTLRLVAFHAEQIDHLERKSPTGLSDQALLDLWRNGEGKTLSSQSLKTVHGVNAIIEMIDEIIYPAETRIRIEDEIKTEYTEFETRSTGNILNVTPTTTPDFKAINLVILPEFTTYKGLNPDMDDKIKAFSPIFQSLNTTTSLVVPQQGTRVIGQTTSKDGTQQFVLFISAEIQEADGTPLNLNFLDLLIKE